MPAWAGYPSTCTWTATFTETMTTSAALPTISAARAPTPMVAGQGYTLTWNATNATSVTRSCTASGTGYNGTSTMPTVSGTSAGTADPLWVGYPSTCTWTATGSGGSATFTETMTTSAAATVSVTRTPSPMVAGQTYTLTWSSTNATSVSRSCTSTGTGFTDNSTLAVSGTSSGTANSAWVGYPSTCTWTASGSGGTATYTETMTTSAAPDPVTYFHNDLSGTPQLATDASGNVLWKENYHPYGNKLNNPAAAAGTNKLGFAGKPYDGNSGLSYMGARYYDPMLGRFMGVDPKGADPEDVHSFNRYAYANNNPYKFVDPDGNSPTLAVPAVVLLVGGGIVYAISPPAQQRKMTESANRLMRKVDEVVDRVKGLVLMIRLKGQTARCED